MLGSSPDQEALIGWQNSSNPCAGILDFNDSSAFEDIQQAVKDRIEDEQMEMERRKAA